MGVASTTLARCWPLGTRELGVLRAHGPTRNSGLSAPLASFALREMQYAAMLDC